MLTSIVELYGDNLRCAETHPWLVPPQFVIYRDSTTFCLPIAPIVRERQLEMFVEMEEARAENLVREIEKLARQIQKKRNPFLCYREIDDISADALLKELSAYESKLMEARQHITWAKQLIRQLSRPAICRSAFLLFEDFFFVHSDGRPPNELQMAFAGSCRGRVTT